jgi:hypothetical protein
MKISELKQLIKEEIQKEIKVVGENNSLTLKKMLEYGKYDAPLISSFFPYDTLEQWMDESEYHELGDEDDAAEVRERYNLAKTYYAWKSSNMILHLYVGVNEDVDIISLSRQYKNLITYGTGYEEVYVILSTF